MFQRIIWHRSHPWRPMASSTHIFMQKWSFLRYFSKRAEFCDPVQSWIPKLCLHAKNQPSSPKIDHFTGIQIFGPTTDFSLGVPATVQGKNHLKILLAPWNSIHCEKKSRSFNAKNFGSVGQRAAKLLAVKVGVLKKKSAASAIPSELCASAIGPGSSLSGVESFSKFEAR